MLNFHSFHPQGERKDFCETAAEKSSLTKLWKEIHQGITPQRQV
jgi:hypothetical protein